jgi:hypothetical protein
MKLCESVTVETCAQAEMAFLNSLLFCIAVLW